MLRTAVLAYVRVLLCLQGLYLVLVGWLVFLGRGPDTRFGATLAIAVAATLLGGAQIVTAVLVRRSRPPPVIAAIVIEALWTAAAAAGYAVSLSGAPVWQYFVGAALFLAAIAGLLLPPARAFA